MEDAKQGHGATCRNRARVAPVPGRIAVPSCGSSRRSLTNLTPREPAVAGRLTSSLAREECHAEHQRPGPQPALSPIHVTTVLRAFSLLYAGPRAPSTPSTGSSTSRAGRSCPRRSGESVGAVAAACASPVIVLTAYERLPKTRVRFSRLNIYPRYHNTCSTAARPCRAPSQPRPRHPALPRRRHHLGERRCSCVPCNLPRAGAPRWRPGCAAKSRSGRAGRPCSRGSRAGDLPRVLPFLSSPTLATERRAHKE
jgi:hypothetical protein